MFALTKAPCPVSGHVVDSLSQLWAGHHPVITAISRCPHLTPRYLAAHGTGGRCELFKVHSHIKLQSPTSALDYFWIHCHGPVMNCRTTTQEGGGEKQTESRWKQAVTWLWHIVNISVWNRDQKKKTMMHGSSKMRCVGGCARTQRFREDGAYFVDHFLAGRGTLAKPKVEIQYKVT